MERSELLELLAARLLEHEPPHPLRFAIDGPDAAGKTILADELAELLRASRPVIGVGIDGFHNPPELRYRRGPDSPEGYFLDSFDFEVLRRLLLEPLGPGGSRRYRRRAFDYRADEKVEAPEGEAPANAILLFDGIFLLRPELRPYWDFSIFLQVEFDEIVWRAEVRDAAAMGGIEAVRERCRCRYLPGQELYFSRCVPQKVADVVIDNTDLARPEIVSSGENRCA